jgi:hypothetical protein
MICNRCCGDHEVTIYEDETFRICEKCYKCNGTGKIDWVDNVISPLQTTIDFNILEPMEYNIDNKRIDNMSLIFKLYKNREIPSKSLAGKIAHWYSQHTISMNNIKRRLKVVK